VSDYVVRQKLGGQNMTFGTSQQLPALLPSLYAAGSPWEGTTVLDRWLRGRVLELTYTAHELKGFAAELGDNGAPFLWNEARRTLLRAELDAAYFMLYIVDREDVSYILDTFPIVRRKDEARYGEYRTKRRILEIYDAMAQAIETGEPYQTLLDPPPGQGPRHGTPRGGSS